MAIEMSSARVLPALLFTVTSGPAAAPSNSTLSAPAVMRQLSFAGSAAPVARSNPLVENTGGCSPPKNQMASKLFLLT